MLEKAYDELEVMMKKELKSLAKRIAEASFEYDGLFCSVDGEKRKEKIKRSSKSKKSNYKG